MSLRQLFRARAERRTAAREAGAAADPIIDRLVLATEKRLAQASGYRERLRGPVLQAHGHLASMIGRIPGPIEVSARSWAREPGLKPLFARGEDAAASWSRDEGVRTHLALHPASDCFGMLALAQSERRVLGTVQQGELQVEVARTTVSFAEPQVLAPAAGEAAVREELAMRALEYLALRSMEEVGAMRAQKRSLEKERALLQAQVQLAQRRGRGFGGIATGSPQGDVDAKTAERDLARTVGELEHLASKNLLPVLLETLLAALARPEEHLTIEPCALTLDPMNFAVASSPQAVTPSVATLKLARRGPFAVLIGRFPHAALEPVEDRLAEASRYL